MTDERYTHVVLLRLEEGGGDWGKALLRGKEASDNRYENMTLLLLEGGAAGGGRAALGGSHYWHYCDQRVVAAAVSSRCVNPLLLFHSYIMFSCAGEISD